MGNKLVRILAAAILVPLMLTGCWRFSTEELKDTPRVGTPFQKALAEYYQKLAESEAAQYDWVESNHFAKKGIAAAGGTDVEPDKASDRTISETMRPALDEARANLIKIVNKDAKKAEPETAALAYYLYDCWIEQLEDNWQVEHIESCRSDFFETLDYLSVAVDFDKSGGGDDLAVDPKLFEKVKRKGDAGSGSSIDHEKILKQTLHLEQETRKQNYGAGATENGGSYVVFFDLDSAALDERANEVIKEVIGGLSEIPEYTIKLNGYADRSGNAEYNQKLSEKRTKAVKSELIKRGVVENSIETFSFGEEESRQKTQDGEKAKANRIVEIFIH